MDSKQQTNWSEMKEPLVGLAVGIIMMVIVFLVVHFIFGFKAFQ